MKKLPLTIVVAVLNEGKILQGFLEHIRSFADEIIVVIDYRNTDNSPAIAKRYRCKVLIDRGRSNGVVFNNKNWGVSEARNEWVLILDADERMDSIIQKEISAVVSGRYRPIANLYQTSFINYEFGKLFYKSDQKNKPFIRLFRKGSFSYQTSNTAEGFGVQTASLSKNTKYSKLLLSIPLVRSWYLQKISGVVTLKGRLIHLSHPTIIDFIKKIDHYSSREANILFQKNSEISETRLVLRIIFSPVKEFLYKYFIWQLYKEGIHGYIVSVIHAFYFFLINAKYFRYVYRKRHIKEIIKISKKYDFENL